MGGQREVMEFYISALVGTMASLAGALERKGVSLLRSLSNMIPRPLLNLALVYVMGDQIKARDRTKMHEI